MAKIQKRNKERVRKYRAYDYHGNILCVVQGKEDPTGYSEEAYGKAVDLLMQHLPSEKFIEWLNTKYNFIGQYPEYGNDDLEVGMYI